MTEPTQSNEATRPPKTGFNCGVISLVILLALVGVNYVWWLKTMPTERSNRILGASYGKQIAAALKRYAHDHGGGRYPETLSALAEVGEAEILKDQYKPKDWDTKRRHEWIYFPGGSENDPEDRILLASDPIYDGDRIVIFNSGDGEFVGPERYGELIAKMRADGCQIPAEAVR